MKQREPLMGLELTTDILRVRSAIQLRHTAPLMIWDDNSQAMYRIPTTSFIIILMHYLILVIYKCVFTNCYSTEISHFYTGTRAELAKHTELLLVRIVFARLCLMWKFNYSYWTITCSTRHGVSNLLGSSNTMIYAGRIGNAMSY